MLPHNTTSKSIHKIRRERGQKFTTSIAINIEQETVLRELSKNELGKESLSAAVAYLVAQYQKNRLGSE